METKNETEGIEQEPITRSDHAALMQIMNDYANAEVAYGLAIERLKKMGLR